MKAHVPSSFSESDLCLSRQLERDVLETGALDEVQQHPPAELGRVGVSSRTPQDDLLLVEHDLDPRVTS